MAFSLFRIGRFLRSIFVPTASILAFSCLLTFFFVLYQHTPGPGSIQRIGWQSWDVVYDFTGQLSSTSKPSEDVESPSTSTGSTSGSGSVPEGVDWWNVTSSTETLDTASLPLDVWDPLMQHDTGRKFFIRLDFRSSVNPFSSVRDSHHRVHVRPIVPSLGGRGPMLSPFYQGRRRPQGQVGAGGA